MKYAPLWIAFVLATVLGLAGDVPCSSPGDVCFLNSVDGLKGGAVLGAASPSDFDELVKALRANDKTGLYELQIRGRAKLFSRNTKFRVLAAGEGWTEGRTEGGFNGGLHIWTLSMWLVPDKR